MNGERQIIRTDWTNKDFKNMVKELDAELAVRDGAAHAFYHQFNGIEGLQNCLVVYEDGEAVGCGALKPFAEHVYEVKRMYVREAYRKRGIARLLLEELEKWATDLTAKKLVLETGKNQPEAIALYASSGYVVTPNYAQYAQTENSVCFEKPIIPATFF